MSVQAAGEDSVEEWLELPNGCLCCTIKTTAMQAIESLLRRKSKDIDYILLETTGLADPYPIINSFWADEALECLAYLDGVLCLVDAKNITKLMEEWPVLKQQIIMADAILINKIDLIDGEQNNNHIGDTSSVKEIKRSIGELNPLARIFTSRYGRCEEIDILKLLDIKAYGAVDCSFAAHQESYLNLMDSLSLKASHSHNSITSVRLTARRPISRAKFEKWLFGLLWQEDSEARSSFQIFRGKGLLRVQDESGRKKDILVQAVRDLYDITELPAESSDTATESVLVLLGTFEAGDEDLIRSSFYSI